MAAMVENNTRAVDYWGRHAVEFVNVTGSSGDTFDSEWASVSRAIFVPTTASAYGLTISGKTVTLVSGGALTGELYVFN